MADRTRYAIVGTGGRSGMYSRALAGDYREHGRLAGLCDLNHTRMGFWNQRLGEEFGMDPIPTYTPDQFDRMIHEQRIDSVIVTTLDRTHHRYIVRAMELGCDAITEKPMTVDASKCQQILDAIERTGRDLRVTFNYRYAPRSSRVKELLSEGAIGDVLSVHFEWLLDTMHGADYFRRWHRDKRNSGGLMVHKATHHFDLVNWWIGSHPLRVFGMGDLKFYGRENAEERGETSFYDRAHEHPNAVGDPFALHLQDNDRLRRMYLDAEHEDGYRRDQSVFGDGISIEDDMSVMVRYASDATMTYHLTAYSPWEGYRVAFNGTKGRLEYEVTERAYVSGEEKDHNMVNNVEGAAPHEIEEPATLLLRPHWGGVQKVDLPQMSGGGHGGGDQRLLWDLFVGDEPDPLGRAAGWRDGAMSILTGIAANRSFATGQAVEVDHLVRFPPAAASRPARPAARPEAEHVQPGV